MPLDNTPTVEIANPNAEALALARRVQALLATPEGWCQGVTRRGDAYCVMAAVGASAASASSETMLLVHLRIRKLIGGCTIEWNDDPARTHTDIVALTATLVASFE
jgi:hypothetical protein